ncbi:hypothetical protein GCM10012275_20570 [Longimycelium tulufanense]|uniref:IrrE N-terminal-like domain-containing protein n=1 Tax=Longimycelium tulufanense TaxID=907463 RepID=A0A8J3C7N2_9PSEU|nr:hypothetical protein [Longimycelium tulufanense]GGM49548.1 hypothetical protein GCM10012275_20570 [Longimycelium tulufanense]
MVTRDGYKRCQALVDSLTLPRPFSVSGLLEMLALLRRRPIDVRTLPAGHTINACGAWLRMADRDVIFVEDKTSQFHRDHIVLHEIGHMLCDHQSGTAGVGHGVRHLVPHLSPGLIERLLTRAGYTTDEEQEAELVASLVRIRAQAQSSWTATGVLGELEDALGMRER